jgi:hypothetical protein
VGWDLGFSRRRFIDGVGYYISLFVLAEKVNATAHNMITFCIYILQVFSLLSSIISYVKFLYSNKIAQQSVFPLWLSRDMSWFFVIISLSDD